MRTIAPQATKPSSEGPGRSGSVPSALPAISAQTGSSRSSGPTRIRAFSTASRGEVRMIPAARARSPGAHQESSSANATNGVPARSAPIVRARAPTLRGSGSTVTPGCAARTARTEPSVEALSTKTTAASCRGRETSRSSRRSRLMTTTVTSSVAAGDAGRPVRLLIMGSWCPQEVPAQPARGSNSSSAPDRRQRGGVGEQP